MALSRQTMKRIKAMQEQGKVTELPRPIPKVIETRPAPLTRSGVQREAERLGYEQGPFQHTPTELLQGAHPRRFVIEWNHERETTLNVDTERTKYKTVSCWGTFYPGNGRVTLDNGMFFLSYTLFLAHFESIGVYRIEMVDA